MPVLKIGGPLLAALAAAQTTGVALSAREAAAADTHWLDIESRIQYSYYTEDVRALDGVASQLTSDETADGMKSYFLALVDYRLGQLQGSNGRDEARTRAENCVANLDRSLPDHRDFADALALQSACLARLAALGTFRAGLAAARSATQMARALRIAPKNPRVLLIDAVDDYERAPNSVEKAGAIGKLHKAIAALEGERQDVAHVPGWGLADAYAYLGRAYLQQGNAVAAREALEHALLAVPQYAEARRMMSRITASRTAGALGSRSARGVSDANPLVIPPG